MEIEIDPEFQAMIPPLAEEERRQLEENIIRDGCRDPLVVWPLPEIEVEFDDETIVARWEDAQLCYATDEPFRVWRDADLNESDWTYVLIDGHNRYEICTRLGIGFETAIVEFANREAAADWIDANQLGRRNLSPEQMSLLRGRRYNRTKKAHGGQIPGTIRQNDESISTAERLAQQHGVSPKTIERDGQFAEAVEVLGLQAEVAAGVIDAPKQAIVQAARPIIEATRAHRRWEDEAARAPLAPPPEPPLPTKDDIQKAKAHVAHNSGENEWYTPAAFVESARAVLGVIDCDPASCELANKTVQASSYFTKENDGLSKRWFGNVWMNPPYAQPLMSQFAEAVSSKYESGEIASAIVLVNNATETSWFQRMLASANAVCFVKSRIKFIDQHGKPSGAPLQGQAILYFGKYELDFSKEFEKHGKVLFNG